MRYGTVACVRNVWNDKAANVSGLSNLPQWLDYHHLRASESVAWRSGAYESPIKLSVAFQLAV